MTSIRPIEPRSLAVQTAGLGKRFGTRAALEGVNLKVPRGSAFGFLGPNGAGKTTLIRLLLGLAEPSTGRMRLLGRDLPAGRVAALARVSAIIEEPRFHAHLTGRENLDVHAATRDQTARARIDGALERVGLAARADDRVKAYSLGMRQRLGIARCLLADPELLILDEPMNGLDPAGILEFRRLIRELVGEGRTVLLSSHLLDEVEKTCDVAAIVETQAGSSPRARSTSWCAAGRGRSTSSATARSTRLTCLPRCPGSWRASGPSRAACA